MKKISWLAIWGVLCWGRGLCFDEWVVLKRHPISTFGKICLKEIAHAQRKLVVAENPITEIAYESGFNSISRFNAAFLKKNGCTPRNFRKRYQEQ